MSLKKFIKVNSKRLIGTSLLLSLMAVQSVGAAGTITDEIVSKGNIEYDANNDGTADVYFYSKDLTAIATGIDSLNTNVATLNTAMETLKETTSGYKTDIISALNSNVYSTNNISSSATFEDIIAKINAIEKKTVSQTLNPGSSYTLAAGYYTGGTVAANANTQTYTYAANSTGGTVDLGAANLYRYVNASNVYTKGKADGVASTNATATGAQVLNGYTFWANGSKLTGTMANYSSSTGQSSTTANTSNYLFVKPSNAGYYTSASSFNTGIAYNPNKTIAESSSSTSATGTGTTSATNIYLDSEQKVTLPAGYYSDAQTIQNVASGGSSYHRAKIIVTNQPNEGSEITVSDNYGFTFSNNRLTCTRTGTYLIVGVRTESGSWGGAHEMYVNINGTQVLRCASKGEYYVVSTNISASQYVTVTNYTDSDSYPNSGYVWIIQI